MAERKKRKKTRAARPAGGPRRLLLRLHRILGGEGTAETRLRRVVRTIAETMGTDVCSCYLRRAGDLLELFATHGLDPGAVHRTRLRIGEGLVGAVAARGGPIALADAPAHPRFAFRPETGEEPFRSFLGVPLLRGGRVIGVLVVQNEKAADYGGEDVEVLQTVAMVLAEMVASSGFVDPAELAEAAGNVTLPRRLRGTGLAGGVGIGRVVRHGPPAALTTLVADDPDAERARLDEAIGRLTADLDRMAASAGAGGAGREILEAFRMFVGESGWTRRIREHVGRGLAAEAAVARVQEETRARMLHVPDAYLRERLADFDDIANRLRARLSGDAAPPGAGYGEVVVVAREIGPAALLEYGADRVRGLVLEGGSPSTHVAIIARGLGIPVVGHVREATLHLEEGMPLAVDGGTGDVHVDPSEDVLDAFRALLRVGAEDVAWHERLRGLPAATLDGVGVSLSINAGFAEEADQVEARGADGIGLYRTEMPFLIARALPDSGEQRALYEEVLERAGGRPVTFRTLDVGGDKRMEAVSGRRAGGDNPAAGWRGIRISSDQPEILKAQLRALVAAHAGRAMRVMFPMVADVADFARARRLLDREIRAAERAGGAPPARVEAGIMVEVPSILWQLDALLAQVDFLSVGTNDFCAFLYASDRADPVLGRRYPFLSAPPLRALRELAAVAGRAGTEISVCGEAAGRPLEALALLAVGFRRLSLAPSSLGAVKEAVRSFRLADAVPYVAGLLDAAPTDFRGRFRNFVRDHGVRV